jgi:excisionase family DNA binding protein
MLTIKQAAEMLQVHRNTIYNWMKAGNIQVIRLSPRTFRIEPAELERMKGKK